MNETASTTIEAYIPAAKLMVEAHSVTNTLNEAVDWIQMREPQYEATYLRLIWLGVNAKSFNNFSQSLNEL